MTYTTINKSTMVGRDKGQQQRGDSAPSVPGVRSNGGESRRRRELHREGGGEMAGEVFFSDFFCKTEILKNQVNYNWSVGDIRWFVGATNT